QELVVLVKTVRKRVEEGVQPLDEVRREVAVHAADPVVVQGQPRAAELLEQVQQDLALAEGPEEDGHGADVEGLGAEPEEMPDDPLHPGYDRPDVLGASG